MNFYPLEEEFEDLSGFIPVFIPWFHTLVSYLGFYMSFLSGFMSFVPWLHTLVSDSGFIHAFIPYRQKRGFIPLNKNIALFITSQKTIDFH
jgi:hypothetical protein